MSSFFSRFLQRMSDTIHVLLELLNFFKHLLIRRIDSVNHFKTNIHNFLRPSVNTKVNYRKQIA